MSDEVPATPEATTPVDAAPPEVKTVPYDRFKTVNDEAKSLRTRLAEVEGRLADGDKLKTELAAERSLREAGELNLTRLRVATSKNIPVDLADRLVGSNEAELAADADKLLKLGFGRTAAPAIDGERGDAAPTTFSKEQLSDPKFYAANRDEILRAMREGRLR